MPSAARVNPMLSRRPRRGQRTPGWHGVWTWGWRASVQVLVPGMYRGVLASGGGDGVVLATDVDGAARWRRPTVAAVSTLPGHAEGRARGVVARRARSRADRLPRRRGVTGQRADHR